MKSGQRSTQLKDDFAATGTVEEFLTPEQRLDLIAEILADIALRITRDDHENSNH
jgi:hypothetical protein